MKWSWELGSAAFSEYDDDGILGIQLDPHGDDAGAPTLELTHTFGFHSRPLDPDPNGVGCSVLVGASGSRGAVALLGNDPRALGKIPQSAKGSSVQYAAKGAFSLLDGETSTWTLYVPTEFDGSGEPSAAHVQQMGLDGNGEPTCKLTHSDGQGWVMFDKKVIISNAKGDAYIELGPDGIILNGNVKTTGGIAVGAAPLPLVMQPALATALAQFAAAIALAIPAPPDGGAAILVTIKAAAAALASAAAAMATTTTTGC